MGDLVCHEAVSGHLFAGSGILRKEHPSVVEKRDSGMLHTSELEVVHHREVVFLERERNPGVILHPMYRPVEQVDDFGALRHLVRVGFAVEHIDSEASVVL